MSLKETVIHLKSQLSPAKQALLAKRLRGETELNSQVKSLSEDFPEIVPNPNEQYQPFPLSDVQQAYWIGRQGVFELGNVASQVYLEIDTLNLDLKQFETAWQQLIDRHGMLRAIMTADGQQQILDAVPAYTIKVVDLRGETPEIVASQLAEIRHRLSHQILPTDQWPLFTIQASLLDEQKIKLHFNFDLLICDVWSIGILSRELAEFMQHYHPSLPPINLSFRDYILAEIALRNSGPYRRSLAYWHNRLATLPPAPELPLEKSLTTQKLPQFVRRPHQLAPTLWQRLKQRATQVNITPSALLLAAFAEILTRWSKTPQFSINLTLFNPLPLHPEVNQIVGDFTSLTLLAIDHSAPDSFENRARRIQAQLWEDLDHRYVSGVQVLREFARTRGQTTALMPVVFTSTLTQNSRQQSLPLAWLGELVYSITQTPQVYLDHQVFEESGALILYWDAIEEVFPKGLLDEMFASYCKFLERLAQEEEIWQTQTRQFLASTPINSWEISTQPDLKTALIHSLFFERVALHPQKIAIVTSERTLTYQELSDRATQIAKQLRQRQVRPNQLIAVVMEKGWEQVVATLGILAAGAAYVPIDPSLPLERRWHLLTEAEVQYVLTQSWLETSLEWPETLERFCVDLLKVSEPLSPLEPLQGPSDLAYVIYTSGSTGKPKGVMIDHQGVVNTILDINQRFNVTETDRIFALSSLSFDLSVYDIFGSLAAGGTLIFPDADGTKDPAHWLSLIRQQNITVWNSVPALMQMLVEYVAGDAAGFPQSLRLVLLSGDWLPLNLPHQLKRLCPTVQIISLGGATEASIWSIFYPIKTVEPHWKSIPYGRPLNNQQVYVLNDALEVCPTWVSGQLYIGGMGLAKGYWKNPEKTQASLILHPQTQERLYKTGDLGRYLPDGNIEFLGRSDFQVKINGHRIELGEIEAILSQHPAIKDAIVSTVGESREHQQLVAYLVQHPEQNDKNLEPENLANQRLWNLLVKAGAQQAENEFWDLDFNIFLELWRYQDHLYLISVGRALTKLGVYQVIGEKYEFNALMSRCQIAPRYRKWFKRALKVLVQEGFLQQNGWVFESLKALPTVVFQELSAEVKTKLAQSSGLTQKWIHLLPVEPLDTLADILTETLHSSELYASEKTITAYEIIFADCNAIIREIIQVLVQNWEAEQPLRILEIGGGYGTTATHIFPLLPPEKTHYWFTDISRFFLHKAQEKFSHYSFIQYDLLNIEQPPATQGYQPQSFDLILATTILHNTRDLEETLKNVRSLLTPNGLLLALEKTQFHRAFDLNMGLQQGFERFEDEILRPEHPILTKLQWQQTLSRVGFAESILMNRPQFVNDFIGFDVLMARNQNAGKTLKANELRDFLQKHLPEYMIPAAYVFLEAMPLTANGKIDRKGLPVPKEIFSPVKTDYSHPQTEIEKQIAEIWQEVLKRDQIGIHDQFFELGGDSLLATQAISRTRQTFQIDLSLKSLFEAPTVAGMAKQIEQICQVTRSSNSNRETALEMWEEGEL